jgi:hypothetical protein
MRSSSSNGRVGCVSFASCGEPSPTARVPRDLIKITWSFEKVSRPRLDAAQTVYGSEVPVIRLRNEREINDFLANQPRSPS